MPLIQVKINIAFLFIFIALWTCIFNSPFYQISHPFTPCYELSCIPPNLYVEALTPNVTVSGDRALKETVKVK